MNNVLATIEEIFHNPNALPASEINQVVQEFVAALEEGNIRSAQKVDGVWRVDERVKEGILVTFRVGQKAILHHGLLTFIDKDTLKPRAFSLDDGVRVVPGAATVRRGAHVGKNVIIMSPSYINIGAFVDEGSLVDSHALVGSCAQIGKRVHLSAGAQIGGVLEPVGALPVIIEDDVLIGGNCGLYEGVQVGERAVLGAGVILAQSTKVYDLVNRVIIVGSTEKPLAIPAEAVVIPGARAVKDPFAHEHGLSVTCPLIIKYRDQKTDSKTELEELLRM